MAERIVGVTDGFFLQDMYLRQCTRACVCVEFPGV